MTDSSFNSFAALSPSGAMGVPQAPAAPRSAELAGRKIALVWNHVFRGNEIFPVIEDALKSQFADVEFVGYDAFGSIMGGDEEDVLEALPGKLAELKVDGVLTGIGC